MIMNAKITPAPVLRPRADTSTTSSTETFSRGSNGCVICPSDSGSCPACPDGKECNLTTQTCDSCPRYVCIKSANSSSVSGAKVGGIVGGVIGGVVVVLLALGLYYVLVYRKKHPRLDEDSDGYDSKYEMDSQNGGSSNLGGGAEGSFTPQGEKLDGVSGNESRRRLSSYESFMRPPGYAKKNGGGNRRRGLNSGAGSPMSSNTQFAGSDMSKRHSVATTVSTTNASNILPIAYIPGVTIRPTKNNTRSIFSYDTDSVFSDMNGIDTASIVHERSESTAVKAQARLVNVAKIDEDIIEEDEEESEIETENRSHVQIHIEGDSDSDIDSDIGEIKRATSTRRNPGDRDVFEDSVGYENEGVNGHEFSLEHEESFDDYDSAGEKREHDFSRPETFENSNSTIDDDDDDDDDDDGSKSFVLDIARET